MKNSFYILAIILVAIVGILGFVYLNDKIVTSQRSIQDLGRHPTQDERLEVYTSHRIHELIDLWQVRVVADVVIFSQDADGRPISPKEIVITIVSANNEDTLSRSAKDLYIRSAESVAKSILMNYGVASEYKLIVQGL